jgi:hypothetical protein
VLLFQYFSWQACQADTEELASVAQKLPTRAQPFQFQQLMLCQLLHEQHLQQMKQWPHQQRGHLIAQAQGLFLGLAS